MMNILLSNDDGIRAPGLWAMARELARVASVTIVAPDREQSGVGTSVTFHHPLRVKEEASEVEGVAAYSVEGTPGDSIILALRLPLLDGRPDLVISGINEGANLGDDVFISGTVGAAVQAYFNGLIGMAVSVTSPEVNDFSCAAAIAGRFACGLLDLKLPGKHLFNLNLPNLPIESIQGLRITRLAERQYADHVTGVNELRKRYYWIGRGTTVWANKEGTDKWAIDRDYGSVTPLMASPRRLVRSKLRELLAHSLPASMQGQRG